MYFDIVFWSRSIFWLVLCLFSVYSSLFLGFYLSGLRLLCTLKMTLKWWLLFDWKISVKIAHCAGIFVTVSSRSLIKVWVIFNLEMSKFFKINDLKWLTPKCCTVHDNLSEEETFLCSTLHHLRERLSYITIKSSQFHAVNVAPISQWKIPKNSLSWKLAKMAKIGPISYKNSQKYLKI